MHTTTNGGEDQEPEGTGASRQERGLSRWESGLFLVFMTEIG
jgi:hypothetical protein